jgi:hypothetical protein
MNWLNLHIPSQIRSPDFIGSSPAERGTWICVLAYGLEVECGGRLEGAARWKDRQWQQACGVTMREVRAASRLLRFDGEDLLINGYPENREEATQQQRSAGSSKSERKSLAARMNGMKGGRPSKPNETHHAKPNENPTEPILGLGIGEGEGEGEPKTHGQETHAPTEQDPAEVIGQPIQQPPPRPAVPPPTTGRDLLAQFGGMLDWFRSRDGRQEAESDLDAVLVVASPAEIRDALLDRFKTTGEKTKTRELAELVKRRRDSMALEAINRPDPVVVRGMQVACRLGPAALRKRFGFQQPDDARLMDLICDNLEVMRELSAEA